MATAYKNKIYTGKNITWNQLIQDNTGLTTRTVNGITYTNNKDGTFTVSGIATTVSTCIVGKFTNLDSSHKYLYCGTPYGGAGNTYSMRVYASGVGQSVASDLGEGAVITGTSANEMRVVIAGTNKDFGILTFTPQLFDLTLMFGAGNEPATATEFWSHFDRKYYPYNTGESQPLFLISRKRKIKSGDATLISYKTKIKEG